MNDNINKIDNSKEFKDNKNQISVKKLVYTALFTSVAVVGSTLSFPVMGSKCAPVQHLVNVLSAVILGPGLALCQAFLSSLIRNYLALGTLLAFPSSIFGALLASLFYMYKGKKIFACIGEVIGTGIIGALVSYPIALLFLDNKLAVITTFIFPFFISSLVGTLIAFQILIVLEKSGILRKMTNL